MTARPLCGPAWDRRSARSGGERSDRSAASSSKSWAALMSRCHPRRKSPGVRSSCEKVWRPPMIDSQGGTVAPLFRRSWAAWEAARMLGGCGRASPLRSWRRRSATRGRRAWRMGKVSAHEAQYAARRERWAERRPHPPKRNGSWAWRSCRSERAAPAATRVLTQCATAASWAAAKSEVSAGGRTRGR